jgi:hypothetical protein
MPISAIVNSAPTSGGGTTLQAGKQLAILFIFTGADATPGDQYTVTVKDSAGVAVPTTWDVTVDTLTPKVASKCYVRFVSSAGVPNPGNYTVELQKVAPTPSPTPELVLNVTVTPAVATTPRATVPPATPPTPGAPPASPTAPPAGTTQVQANVQHSFGGNWTFAGVVVACLLAIGLCLWGVTWTLNWGKDFLGAGVGHAVEQHRLEHDGKISIEIGFPDVSGNGIGADSASFEITAKGDVTGLRVPSTTSSGTSSP